MVQWGQASELKPHLGKTSKNKNSKKSDFVTKGR